MYINECTVGKDFVMIFYFSVERECDNVGDRKRKWMDECADIRA